MVDIDSASQKNWGSKNTHLSKIGKKFFLHFFQNSVQTTDRIEKLYWDIFQCFEKRVDSFFECQCIFNSGGVMTLQSWTKKKFFFPSIGLMSK